VSRPLEKTGMQIERQPDGMLVIRANPALLRAILVCFGAAVVAAVALQERRDDTRLWLGVIGSLVPFLGAALLERVRFEFDIAQRRLRWRRRNWFRGLSGELAFDEISDVVVRVRRDRDPDRPRANPVPEYRVALVTKAGDLRLSDRTYADAKQPSEVADAIRVALGRPPGAAPVEESIEQLAAGGERIAAIKLARQRLGLSLTEAKQHVDRLRG
jgi:hypothetical protein